MTTEQESTQSAQPKRPGQPAGVCSEYTILANIKPGQADAMRAANAAVSSEENEPASRAALQEIGTLHDARHVIFDDDTRYLFASSYPELTVQQIWKDQRANQAFQEVLDNPANAALLATPAFQKLLDQAQG